MSKTERRRILKRPLSIQESGLSTGVLAELALKLIYNIGEIGASEISRGLRLPFSGVIQPVLQLPDREELVNITGSNGSGEGSYHYTLTRNGIERVRQAPERNQHVGTAPVRLGAYNAMIRAQAIGEVSLTEDDVDAVFDGLVVNRAMLDKTGPALTSGTSVFLYGPPGNGKTTIATSMARLLDIARYRRLKPTTVPHDIDQACRADFADL